MSEAILLNQYSQNNGGGAVIRGIFRHLIGMVRV